jgi:protein O-mannosyl-transferase
MNSGGLKSFLESRRSTLVCLLLAAATLAVYGQVAGFAFTNYDEDKMILDNPAVLSGLTPQGIWWALTNSWFEYWHPVTWWSHMLDCELFGPSPGWHHLVNLGFHLANTLLLFAVLRQMTGARQGRQNSAAFWCSAMVAALFALHPLHVESVAWVAERKDVLSAFFFLLTLWAYGRYAEIRSPKSEIRRKPEVRNPKSEGSGQSSVVSSQWSLFHLPSSIFYLLALLFFALGLMSKPMVVTLPFVLLLLDYWPLRRLQSENQESKIENLLPLLWEKLPFFALSVASCLITYLGVKAEGNILSTEKVPWGLRLANVPVSYARYLGKMIWPTDLAVLYPMPGHWAWWQVVGAVLVLVLVSLWVVLRARSAPYLIVGWLLFLGMLFPTIGVIQVGFHAIADRYTYLPLIGPFIALVWCAADQAALRHWPRAVLTWAAVVVLLVCSYLTWGQAGTWRNGYTLWSHCLAVDPDNVIAHYDLGYVLQHSDKMDEAMEQYRAALRLKPDYFEANLALGIALVRRDQMQEATNYLAMAARLDPRDLSSRVDLGRALAALGDLRAAGQQYEAALAIAPTNAAVPADWGRTLLRLGRASDASERFAQALQLDPQCAEARLGGGVALAQMGAALANGGKLAEAARRYREALQLQPDLIEALNNLAWLLATARDAAARNGPEAIQLAERACTLSQYQRAQFVGTLAAAYAENGQFEQARDTARKAVTLAEAAGQAELAARNRKLLELYQAGKPCRE